MSKIIPVLLAGGVGSRLWPVSRKALPKQFLPLGSELSMLQETVRRLEDLNTCPPLVVCNEAHRFLVAEQLRSIGVTPDAIILEPEGRNTAPAIALAALVAQAADPDAQLLVLPADHFVAHPDAFVGAVNVASDIAADGALVTFGIVPKSPETGYGYLLSGAALDQGGHRLERFVEKPDLATAQSYLADGRYLWNSGMFLFTAAAYLEELAHWQPAMLSACRSAVVGAVRDRDFLRPDAEYFATSPAESIDYAVMEQTARGAVVPLDCGWSDIGAWSALWSVGTPDTDGNVIEGDVMTVATRDSYIRAESRLVATSGVEGLVVVETADAVLVAHRDQVQHVKAIVDQLNSELRDEAQLHQRVYRPWGSYESLTVAEGFQVKRIVVNPGQQLSLQKHFHRAEHWVVVSGIAEVTCDDRVMHLAQDQSTYIPQGSVHRLANRTDSPVVLIEVQSGSYLGEDDIVRLEDDYGRNQSVS